MFALKGFVLKKLLQKGELGTITLAHKCVLFSGRYGSGKETKPVNITFVELYSFEIYIMYRRVAGFPVTIKYGRIFTYFLRVG